MIINSTHRRHEKKKRRRYHFETNEGASSSNKRYRYSSTTRMASNIVTERGSGSDGTVFKAESHVQNCFLVMDELRRDNQLCDIVLRVKGQSFNAHRVVVASCSPYLRAMFTCGMKESNQAEIELKEIEPYAMEAILTFAYTGEIVVNTENVQELLPASSMLQLEDLKLACCSFLENNMDPTNCLGIMHFADTHGCPELIKHATEFACLNFFEVMKSEEFLQLSYEHIRALLTSDNLHVKTEENVFDAYLSWIKHDIEERANYVMPLLDTIRIPYVDDDYLKEKVESEKLIRDDNQCYQLLRGYLMGRSSCQGTYMIKPRTPKETIYVVGGRNRAKCLNSAEKYDYMKNKWIELPCMDQVRTAVGLGSLDGKLYAVGGECEATGHEGTLYLKSVECFDPRVNSWSRIPDMQFPRSFAAVASFNGCLYVIGGETTNHCYSSVECYNPKTNSWTLLPDMHSARSGAGSGVMEGKLYVVGGQDRFTTHYSSVECYNPADDTWMACAEMNYARSGVAVAVLGKYLYAIGGRNRGEQTYYNKVERYCPTEDRWDIISPLLHSRAWPAAAAFCHCIYVAGGYDGQNRLNTLEQYNPDADKWTNMAEMKENRAGCGLAVA